MEELSIQGVDIAVPSTLAASREFRQRCIGMRVIRAAQHGELRRIILRRIAMQLRHDAFPVPAEGGIEVPFARNRNEREFLRRFVMMAQDEAWCRDLAPLDPRSLCGRPLPIGPLPIKAPSGRQGDLRVERQWRHRTGRFVPAHAAEWRLVDNTVYPSMPADMHEVPYDLECEMPSPLYAFGCAMAESSGLVADGNAPNPRANALWSATRTMWVQNVLAAVVRAAECESRLIWLPPAFLRDVACIGLSGLVNRGYDEERRVARVLAAIPTVRWPLLDPCLGVRPLHRASAPTFHGATVCPWDTSAARPNVRDDLLILEPPRFGDERPDSLYGTLAGVRWPSDGQALRTTSWRRAGGVRMRDAWRKALSGENLLLARRGDERQLEEDERAERAFEALLEGRRAAGPLPHPPALRPPASFRRHSPRTRDVVQPEQGSSSYGGPASTAVYRDITYAEEALQRMLSRPPPPGVSSKTLARRRASLRRRVRRDACWRTVVNVERLPGPPEARTAIVRLAAREGERLNNNVSMRAKRKRAQAEEDGVGRMRKAAREADNDDVVALALAATASTTATLPRNRGGGAATIAE